MTLYAVFPNKFCSILTICGVAKNAGKMASSTDPEGTAPLVQTWAALFTLGKYGFCLFLFNPCHSE